MSSGLTLGKAYRIYFKGKKDTTGDVSLGVSGSGNDYGNIALTTSWAACSALFQAKAPSVRLINQYTTGTGSVWVDDLYITQVGALLHFIGDDGAGYQWRDRSGAGRDATISTLNSAWTNRAANQIVRKTLTWSGTHEAKSALGQLALPDGAIITRIILKSTASTSGSGCTVGTTNTAARWVAASALTANTLSIATIANTVASSTADNDNDILVDPDTANFTGSVSIEVHYELTDL